MLIIKIWRLPKMQEKELHELHKNLITAAQGVTESSGDENREVTCIFPWDDVPFELDGEIVIEVIFLNMLEYTGSMEGRLIDALKTVLREKFPEAHIDYVACPFRPSYGKDRNLSQ